MTDSTAQIGVVVIGRNEGQRLQRCLQSLVGRVDLMVYVDSGSTDGSPDMARGMGVHVVDLDLSRPFTMARGRNTGLRHLLGMAPQVKYVQFVDGDCEVVEGWVELAHQTLESRPDVAAVAGRRRERRPEASVYNHLCDLEWDGPSGEVHATGGDVMMRVEALAPTGGFNEAMIAGEEGELCLRLRSAGWKILRLDAAMTLHDAAMTRMGQWWKRAERAGHAYAESAHLHGRTPHCYRVREVFSIVTWGLLMPLAWLVTGVLAVVVWLPLGWLAAAILVLVAVQGWRVFRGQRRAGRSRGDAVLFTRFCLLAKLPQAQGVLRYHLNRLRGRRSALIEYKHADAATS